MSEEYERTSTPELNVVWHNFRIPEKGLEFELILDPEGLNWNISEKKNGTTYYFGHKLSEDELVQLIDDLELALYNGY